MTHQFFSTFFTLLCSVSLFAQSNCNYDTYTSNFITGVTIVQDHFNGTTANNNQAKTHVLNSSKIVNQHLMAFGAGNPEPSPDEYDYCEIERRIGNGTGSSNNCAPVNGILKDAETIVLTACCSPDWMKGGPEGSTEWEPREWLEKPPLRDHYEDYAELVAHLVSQPQFSHIKYIQVWNEMKGFWINDPVTGWDAVAYTDLYNEIWAKVKVAGVRPDIKIGGPYVSLNSYACNSNLAPTHGGAWGKLDRRDLATIEYWLDNKIDADFIVVDGPSRNNDGRPAGINQFEMTSKFTDFMVWLRNLDHPDAQNLPVWWAEWYTVPESTSAQAPELNALMSTGLIKLVKSGVETALLWSPEGDQNGLFTEESGFLNTTCTGADEERFIRQLGLYSDTQTTSVSTTLFYQTQKHIRDYFSKGTTLIDINTNGSDIEVLASPDKMLLVNQKNSDQNITIQGSTFSLTPYQVKLVNAPNGLIAEPTGNCNVIVNSTFTNNTNNWTTENCTPSVQSGICAVDNIANVTNPWDAKLISNSFCLEQGKTYQLQFDAFSNQPRSFSVK